MQDVARVGGKNASIGEMIGKLARLGVKVPGGFATTAQAYRDFLAHGGLAGRIAAALGALDVDDVEALAAVGARIRQEILAAPFPEGLEQQVLAAWTAMGGDAVAVAVRSSATAEDLPEASFAGQQETFLNVRGGAAVLRALHEVYASLFNDRAIAYRVHQGFDHAQVALSVGVQHMVRSDLGSSGVMFTLDTDSGFRDVVFITAAYGLGETVVQGAVNPDEFYVYKPGLRAGRPAILRRNLGGKAVKMVYAAPAANAAERSRRVETVDVAPADRARFSISDRDVEALARQALLIEDHYRCPMDIEWGKDGASGEIYVLQARQRGDVAVLDREAGTVGGRDVDRLDAPAMGPGRRGRGIHHLDGLAAEVAAQDRGPAGAQPRLVDVELVGVDRALHDRLAEAVRRRSRRRCPRPSR